jgi:hypothetical protein
MLTARILPHEEWHKVADRPPFNDGGLPDAAHWIIIVVEEDGEIVASCSLFDTVHWDGFHVNETHRGNPGVFRQLLEQSLTVLQAHGVPGVHLTIPNYQPALELMVERFGFVPAPGKLYIYSVRPPETRAE